MLLKIGGKMGIYEIMFLLKPDIKEEELNAEIEKIKESVKKLKGETIELSLWAKRKLAYPIKKYGKGIYYLGTFKLSESAPQSLSKDWKLDENILRTLIIRKSD
jgi:small subunit ribosomal protein S6